MNRWRKTILPLCALLVDCTDDVDTEPPAPTCTDPGQTITHEPDLPLARQTEHIDIYSADPVCLGTALELEQHAQFVANEVGIELREHIPLSIYPSFPDVCQTPDVSAYGCSFPDGTAFSMPHVIHHELTHAVACQLRNSNRSLEIVEGFAVLFEPNNQTARVEYGLDKMFAAENVDYYGAGHFMRWLYERDGGEALGDFYRRSTGATVVDVLEDIYGMPLAELEQEYLDTSPYQWIPFQQCSADLPHVERGEDRVWRWSSYFDCDSPDTFGPYTYDMAWDEFATQWMYQSFTADFEVPTGVNDVMMGFEQSENIDMVLIQRCPERHPPVEPTSYQGEFPTGVFWAHEDGSGVAFTLGMPGRYRFDVLRLHGPPGPSELSFWVEGQGFPPLPGG